MQVKFLLAEQVIADTKAAVARNNERLLAMAAGKPGSPYTKDNNGRLRLVSNGRYCSVK
jgi:hypothetical protein